VIFCYRLLIAAHRRTKEHVSLLKGQWVGELIRFVWMFTCGYNTGVYARGDFMVHLAGLNDKKKWAKKVLLDIEDMEASDMNAPRRTEANIGEEMQEIDENTSTSVEDSLCTFVVGEESCESQQISPSVVATEGGE
jgi:hypothetical protein